MTKAALTYKGVNAHSSWVRAKVVNAKPLRGRDEPLSNGVWVP